MNVSCDNRPEPRNPLPTVQSDDIRAYNDYVTNTLQQTASIVNIEWEVDRKISQFYNLDKTIQQAAGDGFRTGC